MNNFIIGLDVDGVLADFVGKVLYYQNSVFKTNFKHSDITSYDIESIIGESNFHTALELMQNNHDAKYFNLLPYANTLVSELRKIGRVVFTTAPCPYYRGWADDRFFWLKNNFDATRSDILSISDKTLFAGHVLIDDSPHNIQSWQSINKPGFQIAQPWNNNSGYSLLDIPDLVFEEYVVFHSEDKVSARFDYKRGYLDAQNNRDLKEEYFKSHSGQYFQGYLRKQKF